MNQLSLDDKLNAVEATKRVIYNIQQDTIVDSEVYTKCNEVKGYHKSAV